jgi:dolichol-phosphate mannosyltransferase
VTKNVVVVPTYNEREGVSAFIARFPHGLFDLLIVDDSSPDGTAELVREEAATKPWLHLVVRPVKDGLAGAYRSGFGWALERDFDVVGQMDSDLQHPPEALASMLDALAEADVVVGSRYAAGAGTSEWSRVRRFRSRLAGIPTNVLLRLPVKDPSGGFKLWRASALHAIDVGTTVSRGYVFQIETTYRAKRAGLRIREVPFMFAPRERGESKLTGAVSREGIRVVLSLFAHPWRPPSER